MVPEGVEPSTLALLAPHSNQLSYGTVIWARKNLLQVGGARIGDDISYFGLVNVLAPTSAIFLVGPVEHGIVLLGVL